MSGSAIPFAQVPPNTRVPFFYVEFNNSQAQSSQPVQRTLIVGQATTSVPATPAPAFVVSPTWAAQQWGADSELTCMIAAYRANDTVGELWALPLADAVGSSKAGGGISFAATSASAGTLFLTIAGTDIQVGVTVGMTAAQIATATAAAITLAASQNPLPVTTTANSAAVTVTATNGGTLGNDIPIMLNRLGGRGGQVTPTGVTVTVTALTGGATDPILTNIATWLGNAPFDFILSPYSDSVSLACTTAMMNFSTGRWSFNQQIFGHVWTATKEALATAMGVTGPNDPHLTNLWVNPLSPSPGWLRIAARLGSVVPSIKIQPNQPVQTLLAQGVMCETPDQDIGWANEQAMFTAGWALDKPNYQGPQALRMVTTYTTNANGQPDQSYLDAEDMYLHMAIVRHLRSAITAQIPRALLADDGTRIAATPAGASPLVITPSVAKVLLIADYNTMVDLNWVDDPDLFAKGLVVQRNSQDPRRLDVLYDPYYIVGLRVFAVLNEFHLSAIPAQ